MCLAVELDIFGEVSPRRTSSHTASSGVNSQGGHLGLSCSSLSPPWAVCLLNCEQQAVFGGVHHLINNTAGLHFFLRAPHLEEHIRPIRGSAVVLSLDPPRFLSRVASCGCTPIYRLLVKKGRLWNRSMGLHSCLWVVQFRWTDAFTRNPIQGLAIKQHKLVPLHLWRAWDNPFSYSHPETVPGRSLLM